MLPSPKIREVTLKDYLEVILKKKWVILAFTFVISSTVTIFTLRQTPIYRASASLLIEKTAPKVVAIEEVYQVGSTEEEYYETQYKILKSRVLAKRVLEKLQLMTDEEFSPSPDPVDAFLVRVLVEPARGSRVVYVGFESKEPLKAAKVANTLANEYIQLSIEDRLRASHSASGWLETQLLDMKKKMDASENALNKYVEENKIIEVVKLEEQNSKLLEELKNSKSKLESDIAELSRRYKEKHPQMIRTRSELDTVEANIAKETEHLLDLRQKMIQYEALKREVESNRQLYDSLLKRSKETAITGERQDTNIRIIDLAEVPRYPVKPKRNLNIMMGLAVGALFGTGLAFFLEYLDSSIKTAEDVDLYVRLPFLGYIPQVKETKQEREIVMPLL